MAPAVSRRPLKAEVWVRYEDISSWICEGQKVAL
jgi:hypothetical protein